MEFRRVGSSGLTVSAVGLGTNNLGMKLDMEESREVVTAARNAGITFFDTADAYGASEERLGVLLEGDRDDVIIATKFGSNTRPLGIDNGEDWGARGSRRYIRKAIEGSLRRLRTDWIDLYQMHRPDPHTPLEETLSALDDLVHEGKVRYLGHSALSGYQIADADWLARSRGFERFICAENEYSWINRKVEVEVVPALQKFGLGLIPYFPLASGLLTGKYRRGQIPPVRSRLEAKASSGGVADEDFAVVEALEEFASKRDISLLDIAIGGLAAMPAVASVIAGATSAGQVAANVAAGEWVPTADDLIEIAQASEVKA